MPQFFPAAFLPAISDSGATLSGAKLLFFLAGTTTPRAVFTSPSLQVSLGATVTADSAGRWADIWLDTSVQYKVTLQTAAGVAVKTVDPVNLADTSAALSVSEQIFTGNGSQVAFVLSNVVATSAGQLVIFIDGAYQPISGSYTVTNDAVNTTVTFTSAPPSSSVISMRFLNVQGARGDTGPASALTWLWDTGTTDADPGATFFRFNSATRASANFMYIDVATAFGSVDVSAFLDAWSSSTSSSKGFLVFRSQTSPGSFAVYRIVGSVVSATGYRKVPITHVASSGSWTASEIFSIEFSPIGDKGEAGTGGATYAADIGDGAATSFALIHGLATRDLSVAVRRTSGAYDVVHADVEMTDANTVTIRTVTAPSASEYRVIVQRTS